MADDSLRTHFDEIAEPDYTTDAAWIRRRHLGGRLGDPAVFYVHPTTERTLEAWFADPQHREVRANEEAVVEAHGHAFPGNMWAPAYRQATTRAFHQRDRGDEAYDLAFEDVRAAFGVFLREVPDGPIVLAGHSQGARHIADLLAEIAKDEALSQRVVSAYAVGAGVPAGREIVFEAFPMPEDREQTGVLIGWNASLLAGSTPGANPEHPVLSVNPITFDTTSMRAEASEHLGGVLPPFDRIRVGAREENGRVLVEDDSELSLSDFALPDGSLHAVEVQLFSKDLCADVRRRTRAWRTTNRHHREASV